MVSVTISNNLFLCVAIIHFFFQLQIFCRFDLGLADVECHLLNRLKFVHIGHIFTILKGLDSLLFSLFVSLPLDTSTFPAWRWVRPKLLVRSRSLHSFQIEFRFVICWSREFGTCHHLLNDGFCFSEWLQSRLLSDDCRNFCMCFWIIESAV